jgi:hypothetical protein
MEGRPVFADHLFAAVKSGPSDPDLLEDLSTKNTKAYEAGLISFGQWQANEEVLEDRNPQAPSRRRRETRPRSWLRPIEGGLR